MIETAKSNTAQTTCLLCAEREELSPLGVVPNLMPCGRDRIDPDLVINDGVVVELRREKFRVLVKIRRLYRGH